jgi:tRNA nucleotidyltransferase (CCA-adding enzyme)
VKRFVDLARAPRWEHFPHGSDIGVRGIGRSREEAFEQAALALTGVVTDPARVAAQLRTELACRGDDDEILLYDWLNALVGRMAVDGLLFARTRVQIEDGRLRAELWGEPVDVGRHRPAVEVKGATFTELAVRSCDDGTWIAQCVVDV